MENNMEKDIQDVCDECCDSRIGVNNQYIGLVFQWLIDNDYSISKKPEHDTRNKV